jgi:hypothetical protein
MVTSRLDNEAIHRLVGLGGQAPSGGDDWMYSPIERGAMEAVRRYGCYTASMVMARAKFPIYAALRLIRIACEDRGHAGMNLENTRSAVPSSGDNGGALFPC